MVSGLNRNILVALKPFLITDGSVSVTYALKNILKKLPFAFSKPRYLSKVTNFRIPGVFQILKKKYHKVVSSDLYC